MEAHSNLGPGLLESIYQSALVFELGQIGLAVRQQVNLPVRYKGRELSACLRMDIVVNDELIVEDKAVDALSGIHQAQLLTYLRLTRLPIGLLINFNTAHLRDGIRRFVNRHSTSASSPPLR
jgi:iron complex transport system substrate-binding protein